MKHLRFDTIAAQPVTGPSRLAQAQPVRSRSFAAHEPGTGYCCHACDGQPHADPYAMLSRYSAAPARECQHCGDLVVSTSFNVAALRAAIANDLM